MVVLDHNYRYGGGIGALADAIRTGDADTVLAVLAAGHPEVEFQAAHDVPALTPAAALRRRAGGLPRAGTALVSAASAGDAGIGTGPTSRIIGCCAHIGRDRTVSATGAP